MVLETLYKRAIPIVSYLFLRPLLEDLLEVRKVDSSWERSLVDALTDARGTETLPGDT